MLSILPLDDTFSFEGLLICLVWCSKNPSDLECSASLKTRRLTPIQINWLHLGGEELELAGGGQSGEGLVIKEPFMVKKEGPVSQGKWEISTIQEYALIITRYGPLKEDFY